MMWNLLRTATLFTLTLTMLTGVMYPLLITGVAQLVFTQPANGSLVMKGDMVIGSELIGQFFHSSGYFWGRPSATAPRPYDGSSSSASQLSLSNPALTHRMDEHITLLQQHHHQAGSVPVDLLTTSASGLDPHISPEAAYWQVQRVATARHLSAQVVYDLVTTRVEGPTWGILGEPRVNVLLLNLALDQISPPRAP